MTLGTARQSGGGRVKKLILRSNLSPGDILMVTAVVRDLHRCYPGQFKIGVRTTCAELWEANPYLSTLSDDDPSVETIECESPLINRSNSAPYHYIHAYIEFLNERLGVRVRPTAFRGDIHLSTLEKSWYSQVHELTGEVTPYWIIAAGGKHDVTIKWWSAERYQKVVDHFRGKILFVQIGGQGNYHPKLRGVIDLRGKTTLRELVRLIYHSEGVLCPVTGPMHLAAATPPKDGSLAPRPCVVIAGGREAAHWEAYSGHQFISTTGTLSCCLAGGCWKGRTVPLGDGDDRDKPGNLCLDVVGGLPRCMDMISAGEVIRRIGRYFEGGALKYLTPRQNRAARRGVGKTRNNDYDNAPLTLPQARLTCERFIQNIPGRPPATDNRGIVICAANASERDGAWLTIKSLRRLGCSLPIELWHLGGGTDYRGFGSLVTPLGVECVDAESVAKKAPSRQLGDRELKAYALVHSRFQQILLLQAGNVPVENPESLFASPQYRETGAIFWPHFRRSSKARVIWRSCGLLRPSGPEFETGQLVVDKARAWDALNLALWFNQQSDFYFPFLGGEHETFRLAFHRFQQSYGFVECPPERLDGAFYQHDFSGRRLFQNRCERPSSLPPEFQPVPAALRCDESRGLLRELRAKSHGPRGALRV